jgi:hypothetical protein
VAEVVGGVGWTLRVKDDFVQAGALAPTFLLPLSTEAPRRGVPRSSDHRFYRRRSGSGDSGASSL